MKSTASTPAAWPSTVAAKASVIRDCWNQRWLRPKTNFYYARSDVFEVAAGYAFHLADSQAFIDGNKRTTVVAALVFLAQNGVYVRPAT